jgi:hypothetical protein
MDYEILLNGFDEFDTYLKEIIKFMDCKIPTKYEKWIDYVSLCNALLTIIIHTDEIIGIDVVKEDFEFDANFSIRIEVLRNSLKDGLKLLFELVSYLAEKNLNILLLEGGSEILRRDTDEIKINAERADDNYFPFQLLK